MAQDNEQRPSKDENFDDGENQNRYAMSGDLSEPTLDDTLSSETVEETSPAADVEPATENSSDTEAFETPDESSTHISEASTEPESGAELSGEASSDEVAEPAESETVVLPVQRTQAPHASHMDITPSAAKSAPAAEELLLAAHATPDAPSRPSATSDQPRTVSRLVVEVILVLAVVFFALWSWSLYSSRDAARKQVAQLNGQVAQLNAQVAQDNANPQAIIQRQTDALVAQVGKLVALPTGETPTVALVSNAAQAAQQSAFFKNAQNGDKVLMYSKAGKAILYRSSTNSVILVAPLTFTPAATTTK